MLTPGATVASVVRACLDLAQDGTRAAIAAPPRVTAQRTPEPPARRWAGLR